MTKRIYAIYDVKTGTYGQPMFLLSDGEALRVVQDAVAKPGNVLSDHANDFRLDAIGEFDVKTGMITQDSFMPKHIIEIAQLTPNK